MTPPCVGFPREPEPGPKAGSNIAMPSDQMTSFLTKLFAVSFLGFLLAASASATSTLRCGAFFSNWPASTQSAPVRPRFVLEATFARPETMPYAPHRGGDVFANYVAIEMPHDPMPALRAQIEAAFSVRLRSRRRAHLTVISPREIHDALSARMTMDELDAMAEEAGLQRAPIEVECLGRATAIFEGVSHQTFYVVVRSPAALAFRRRVAAEFRRRGGAEGQFSPDVFFPHVTVGFTHRDLHFEDGVMKDTSTCVATLSP